PALDAKKYWISVRRALLRQPVDRLGLGGYLHLTEGYPDFVETIADIMDEFREIKAMHEDGGVYTLPIKIAVLHSWGRLRSWTLSGHFHETYMHTLIHINEALSGLPVDVRFVSFDDVKAGALGDVDVVINAGKAGTAWSGGDAWKDAELVAKLQKWVHDGGIFLGVEEPSAVAGGMTSFAMAQVLGIDLDDGARVCHGRWAFDVDKETAERVFVSGSSIPAKAGLYLTDGRAKVLAEADGIPTLTVHDFGRGKGIYMAGFEKNNANTRMLLNLLLYAKGLDEQKYLTDDADTECAYYPGSRRLVLINNSDEEKTAKVTTSNGVDVFTLQPFETKIISE
ncbi:MAG: D-galactosyl-beta-1-4-L-rhamnose phosphorylase, partial [Lachnospiraceae bacterium]|nr:D-galactosyl-beta-1-4-L-rhamnose phosphorylase [Lachnospiraceae bacterium]